MNDERIAALERRLLHVEAALNEARRQLHTDHDAKGRRLALSGVWGVLCVGLALLLTVGHSSATPAAAGTTVKAPFTVVSSSGATILQVGTNGLRYTTTSGDAVVLGTHAGGALLQVTNGSGVAVVALGDDRTSGGGSVQLLPSSGAQDIGVSLRATAATGAVTVYSSHAHAALGAVSGSPLASQFFGQSKEALGLGIAPDNTGTVAVRDAAGQTAVNVGVSTLGGSLVVNGKAGTPVAAMAPLPSGLGAVDVYGTGGQLEAQLSAHARGGYMAITTPGGNALVEAGITGGKGVVRAFGPGGFNSIEGRSNSN